MIMRAERSEEARTVCRCSSPSTGRATPWTHATGWGPEISQGSNLHGEQPQNENLPYSHQAINVPRLRLRRGLRPAGKLLQSSSSPAQVRAVLGESLEIEEADH